MNNMFIILDSKHHKTKILNLVWNEACSSYSINNISKNNVEWGREFGSKEEFMTYLEEHKKRGIIENYYELDI